MEITPDKHDDVREAVDTLLSYPKSLAGTAEWRGGTRDGQWRASYALQIEGEHVDASVDLSAYPMIPVGFDGEVRFTIGLCCPRCIWRIDFVDKVDGHTNPPGSPAFLDEPTVKGPHYHAWEDNRHLARKTSIPKRLDCARSLPPQTRKWEQAYRWFCQQTNILLPQGPVIELPPKDGLL
jgi:hypothetical protein